MATLRCRATRTGEYCGIPDVESDPCQWDGTTDDLDSAFTLVDDDEGRGRWITWNCPECGAEHEDLVR